MPEKEHWERGAKREGDQVSRITHSPKGENAFYFSISHHIIVKIDEI